MKDELVKQFINSVGHIASLVGGKLNERMKKSWEDEYIISFYEVDTKNEVFLPILWSFMQETAWHHADHLRVGYSDLAEQSISGSYPVYPFRWRNIPGGAIR